MKKQAILNWSVRLLVLALATGLALGGPLPVWAGRIFPALSPLVALAHGVAARSWYAPLFWLGPPVLMLALAIWRGRWFCRWLCPTGTLVAGVTACGLRKTVWPFRLNGVLFWAALAGGVVGLPLATGLDPLAQFSRLTVNITAWRDGIAWIPGLILPAVLLLGIFQPMLWCTKLCPLGYLLERAQLLTRSKTARATLNQTRRDLLIGAAIGLPLALLARRGLGKWLGAAAGRPAAALPVLPPGADSPTRFAALCTRCYACVHVCPTQVLRPGRPQAGTPMAVWFTPVLDTDAATCDEYCNRCTQACPAGAIRPLTQAVKHQTQIGVAEVIRSACLAWADDQHCMVCQEFCPYRAIGIDHDAKGLPRPVVRTERCRGCGACQNQCPAVRAGKAILVRGVPVQRQLAPVPGAPRTGTD
ncbi:MAG: 4Fe-4S dicluster domain-containing protein [Lentisphaeria bacterium]